jgi:Lrp/AsnC family transcriptional regulator, leucine-responsive regulatory protein
MRVGLSKTPIAMRIRQLEDSGLIAGYRAILSPLMLGLTHVTYVQVRLSDTRETALKRFNEAVRAIPEIEECYMIAGGFDYLLKVRSRDMANYRRIVSAVPPPPFARRHDLGLEPLVTDGREVLHECSNGGSHDWRWRPPEPSALAG